MSLHGEAKSPFTLSSATRSVRFSDLVQVWSDVGAVQCSVVWSRGAACSNSRPLLPLPPPPPDPPKFSNPFFSNLRFWGKVSAPKAQTFFLCPPEGVSFFFFTLCVYTQNAQNFVENSKMGEKHRKKIFDP